MYDFTLLETLEELKELEQNIEGVIEGCVKLKPPIVLGKNSVIKSFSYIEGPVIIGKNCEIGPSCHIKPYTRIGDNCCIGNYVEIKNCLIYDNVNIKHLSYFGDSIIGNNVNIGAGSIAANLRFDGKNIKIMEKNKLIDSGRKKLGAIIEDDVKIGVGTLILPGRRLYKGVYTLPGEVVKKDKKEKKWKIFMKKL